MDTVNAGCNCYRNSFGLVFSIDADDIKFASDFIRLRYDDEIIFFGRGTTDVWCAYVAKEVGNNKMLCSMPSDKYYFTLIQNIAFGRGCPEAMYADFVDIHRRTGKCIDASVVEYIGRLADNYDRDADVMYNMFMHVYYGMVAEENKAHTHLGKSIKLLGLYDLLIRRKSVNDAADCNRGSNWRAIHADCEAAQIKHLARN